jgi:hypothetical protein
MMMTTVTYQLLAEKAMWDGPCSEATFVARSRGNDQALETRCAG